MKAYTVYQPYAYATVAGLKQYETRPRQTHIRGRVAVHAGKKKIKGESANRLYMNILETGRENALAWHVCRTSHPEEYGAIVGTVEIVDCVPVEEIADKLTPLERALGDFSPGRFAWVLKNPIMFDKPIPARGKQGWWHWKEPEQPAAEDQTERILQEIKNTFRGFLGAPHSEMVVAQINERTAQIVKELYFKGEIRLWPLDGEIWLGNVPLEILVFIPYAISGISIFGTYRVLQKGKIIGSVSYGGPQTQDTPGIAHIGARTKFIPAEKMVHISMELEGLSDFLSDDGDECGLGDEPE